MEVALLSELEFKHQVTSDHSSGEGGRQGEGEGVMTALRCLGVQRTRSGKEGEVYIWRERPEASFLL